MEEFKITFRTIGEGWSPDPEIILTEEENKEWNRRFHENMAKLKEELGDAAKPYFYDEEEE